MSSPSLEPIAVELCANLALSKPEFVASGAFKETFKAETKDRTVVAVKLLNPAKCNIERSQREIVALRRCDSPFICKIYDNGELKSADGAIYHFSVEEYLAGGTLAQRMSPKLSIEQIKHYGSCLTESLVHLYPLKFVHRDIKPDNIMFRINSDDPVLVDFGLVRDLSASSITPTWAMQGPGTPLFAAPEQLNNDKTMIGWRTDQFSVGVVLGMCLTGTHPYSRPGGHPFDAINSVTTRTGPDADFRHAATQAGLQNLVKMVAPWPIQRFGKPEDMLKSF